ncbi:MAG: glycosyltransferase family 1 protein [Vampirovibrionales bacterium]
MWWSSRGGRRSDDLCRRARGAVAAGRDQTLPVVCGAIEPRKNIRHLLDCFSAWVSQEGFDDVSLVLVSPPGPMKQALQEYARTHPVLARQVCWLGQQPSPVLGQLLRQAMMLVHPSLYEGFGLTVLEAMARGTPVVASSTTACGEVADEAAWLVDPTDAEALCQAMHAIATDVGHQQRLGKLGRLRAQQFSWETTVRQTLRSISRSSAAESTLSGWFTPSSEETEDNGFW